MSRQQLVRWKSGKLAAVRKYCWVHSHSHQYIRNPISL